MFKLGIITDEVSQNFNAALKVCQDYGLDAVEIRSVNNKQPQNIDADDIAAMKRALSETDLTVCGIATPFYKCEIDSPEDRKAHIGYLERCARLAQEFDTTLLRVFAFWDCGETEERWGEILDAFEEPLRIAEREGVTLGMENEHTTSLATAALTRRFIDEIGQPNVRAIWDPANELYAEDGVEPYPDGYEILKPVLAHGHMKDGDRDERGDMQSVPVGEGLVDWQGQLERYAADGYDGYLTLENALAAEIGAVRIAFEPPRRLRLLRSGRRSVPLLPRQHPGDAGNDPIRARLTP